MATTEKKVLLEKRDGVAWATLNDYEDARNAIGNEVSRAMLEILEDVGKDDSIGVLCITGQKNAFCAGMNLREMVARSEGTEPESIDMRDSIRAFSKVTMAVVNGFCVGGGISLVADCDLAIASDKATFGLPEILRGAPPGRAMGEIGTTISPKYAADMILSGRNFSAEKALIAGLVSRVVPHDQLYDDAHTWAKEIAGFNHTALYYCKIAVQHIQDRVTWKDRIAENQRINEQMHNSGWAGQVEGGAQRFLQGDQGTKANV